MQHFFRSLALASLVIMPSWAAAPAMAAGFQPMVVHPATSATTRSSANRLTARANARANTAAGNPYVNPNVTAGPHSAQTNASANMNAAEMRSAHDSVTTP